MKNLPARPKLSGLVVLSVLVSLAMLPTSAWADPFHSPTIDGAINADGDDWSPNDLVVDDSGDEDPGQALNVRRFWVTWDADNLYLGLTYQDQADTAAMAIYLDLDRGVGPDDATNLDSYAANLRMPEDHRFELVLGRSRGDVLGDLPVVRLVTADDGTTTDISGSVTGAQTQTFEFPGPNKEGRFIFWYNYEAAIPWSAIYPDQAGTVPPYAVIKAVAAITLGSAELNATDTAPDNDRLDWVGDAVLLSNLHASVIDANGDGQPDPCDATISGTVDLPLNDGARILGIEATMDGFPGRDPGTVLSRFTGEPGQEEYLVPRLPAGSFDLRYRSSGYVSDTRSYTLSQSQALAGQDLALVKAASVSGAIAFADGDTMPGLLTISDSQGNILDSYNFPGTVSDYVFYLEEGGQYTLRITADTYLDQERTITLAQGQELTGEDFLLIRETRISCQIGFASGPGRVGTAYFMTGERDTLDSMDYAQTGGLVEFFTRESGTYIVGAKSNTYVWTDTTLTVVAGEDQTDIPLNLPRSAFVTAQLDFEGPAVDANIRVTRSSDGLLISDNDFSAPAYPYEEYIDPGSYRLLVTGSGYVPIDQTVEIGLDDLDLGTLQLTAVRATRLVTVDADGETIPEVRAIYYDPAEDPWTATEVRLQARDEAGRIDQHDLDGRLTDFRLSALKMDDTSAPTGQPRYYNTLSESDTTSVVDFTDGEASFFMSDTAVEVLRVYLAQPGRDPVAGRIVVAFQDPRPTYVVLTAERDTLVADDMDARTISARLFDSAFEPSLTADVPVTFSVQNSSSGVGGFEVATVLTNADGMAQADLTATGSGVLNVSSSVVIDNLRLTVLGGSIDGEDSFLPLTAIAGPTAGWELSLPAALAGLNSPVQATARTVDQNGNATADAGLSFTFSVQPAGLGSFSPATAVSDASGRAVSLFTPSGSAGLVTIGGSGSGFPGGETNLSLRDVQVVNDPPWYNEPPTRRTFPPTDLTAMVVNNDPDALLVEIPFTSNWDGMQIHLLIETGFDAAGATADPFQMPVSYGHDLKPDFVLTHKYSVNDYSDFRRFVGGAYESWIIEDDGSGNPTDNGEWTGTDGQNVIDYFVSNTTAGVSVRIPWTALGGTMPDSLQLECYLTQEPTPDDKRSAFDSVPQDSTLNLTFDWEDPEEGDWDIAENTVTLHNYGPTYVPRTDFPTPPEVTGVTPDPGSLNAGDIFVLSAVVSDGGDGIGDVLADISQLGGGSQSRMHDDGESAHGDVIAGDGVYSLRTVVPWGNPGGVKVVTVEAFDAGNTLAASAEASVEVIANIEPILVVQDAEGDDHGPNQEGVENKYYIYPTNSVFVEGGFDITDLTVYETTVAVAGEDIPMIAFQVGIGDFPDPADPGTADWAPQYANLNIEKIDILIDNAPGGATATLPMRQAAFQRWDAWDFAIVMDGWYKALIPSLGQNTLDSWRENALRTDQDILIVGDPDQDVVTAFVNKAALGNPTAEDIRGWDMAVGMASHDFGGEEVLGGCRWVNLSRSEWNFGGGQNEDRDSNYMDLLLVPGSGHSPGLSQEEILDYESEAALARLENGETPVAIEMSQFEDTGPPVINTGGGSSIVTQVYPVQGAPLSLAVQIVDDYRVDGATFRYRSTGFEGEGWDREVPMGSLGNNRWVVDIMPSWLDSNLVYSPIDSTRYLEFEVEAIDPLEKVSISPVTTLQIWPDSQCRPEEADFTAESVSLLQVEGSQMDIGKNLRHALIARHLTEAWSGPEASADTMGGAISVQWDICDVPEAIKTAPTVPAGQPLGVFRDIYLATADTLGNRLDYPGDLPDKMELSLHYPQPWVPAGVDENKVAIYEYNLRSNRWVLVGGNVTPTGNNVKATVNHTGTFGLFLSEGLNYDRGEVISGITASPNPFSPNGDDLYDECTISFFLSQEATVTVEVFNIQGDRKRVLAETFPFAGTDLDDPTPRRVPGLIWDGRDQAGELVPYGVYVLRITATYNQAGGTRSIRSNHSLAVIR